VVLGNFLRPSTLGVVGCGSLVELDVAPTELRRGSCRLIIGALAWLPPGSAVKRARGMTTRALTLVEGSSTARLDGGPLGHLLKICTSASTVPMPATRSPC
jgi:hypothetical protein